VALDLGTVVGERALGVDLVLRAELLLVTHGSLLVALQLT
jgi:hypothetical protein